MPWFAPSAIIFPIVWTILYFLIAYSVYEVWSVRNNNYKIWLLVNYVANQLFIVCFFIFKSNFLALVDTLIIFISSLYLFSLTKMLKGNKAYYLVPYIIWNLYALILIFTIFVTN